MLISSTLGFATLRAQVVVNPGDDLIQKIANADTGATVIIQPGFYKAQYANVRINKDITITGVTGQPKPKVYIKQIDLQGTNINVSISGIDFSSAVFDSLTNTEDTSNLQDSYFINLPTDFVSADSIIVTNCIIHDFDRCVVRGDRTAYTVNNFKFDNCIIYDFHGKGDYGLFRFKSSITFGTFTLTNSTCYDFKNSIVNLESQSDLAESITVNQCTFDKMDNTKDAKALFDIRNNTNAGAQLSITNCIFGNVDKTNPALRYYGFRFTDASNDEYSFNDAAPGFVVDTFQYDQVSWDKSQFNDMIDPQWVYPDTGNYYLPQGSPLLTFNQDNKIVGDPRWEQGTTAIHNVSDVVYGIYPNPVTTELNVMLTKPAYIAIYNSRGIMLVQRKVANASLQSFDVSGYVAGVYFLRVNNTTTQKFVIK